MRAYGTSPLAAFRHVECDFDLPDGGDSRGRRDRSTLGI